MGEILGAISNFAFGSPMRVAARRLLHSKQGTHPSFDTCDIAMALFFTGFGLPEFDENAAPGPSQLTPEAGSGAAATDTHPFGEHHASR